ncbi:MAG: TonB-dependent receptor domain-containing protein [Vicinamibacterales bacterium]
MPFRFFSLLLLVSLLLAPREAHAQFGSAIQGTITDSQDAVVPGATVRVTNTTTGVVRDATTTADGVYRVLSLGPGAYRVEVEKAGFIKAQRESVNLGISETLRLDFALELSGVSESVTVATTAPLVETEQGRVSGRVDRIQLQEMPLSGRNLYNLIALQPGVTGRGVSASISGGGGADDSFAGESAPRINASGQRDEANSFTVDDTSTNGVARGGITNLTPNTESVEEVRVVANNFSAVDGRNTGAQIQVITKAGTNQFRGSASYYFQSDQLSARNVFETRVPEFSKNQFGYSLGGPIVRNRIFFFTSYEGLRQSGARGSNFTVETPAFRDFVQQTRPGSIAARLLRDFAPAADPTSNFRDLGSPAPGANVIGPADGIMDVGSVLFVPEGWRRGNQFSARADYELRPGRDRLYGQFYRTNSYAVTGGIRPAFNRPTPNTTHFGNINYTHTFSTSKLTELRAGVMRLVGLPDVPRHLEIPAINITGATGFGQAGYPNGWWQTNWHFKDIFTWVASSHMLKLGGELRQMYGSATNTTNYIPAYSFSSLLNFADDEALQMNRYVDPRSGEPVTAYSELTQTEWAIFINDDWKVTRNLTINAGVRYENYGTFKDSDDTLRNIVFGNGSTFAERLASARVDFVDQFYPTDHNNVGPRLGFAWDPTGNGHTAVRGGYGLAYDRLMNLPAENYRHSPPLRASVVLGQFFGTPQFTYSLGDPSRPYLGYPVDPALRVGLDSRNGVIGARVNLTTVDPSLKTPYVHNWFVGVQRELVMGIVADANYTGSAGRNLHNAYNVNRYVGDLLDGRFDGYNPSFGSINMVTSTSRSDYHGGTLQLKRNFRNGFMLQGAYTFGKAMDDADLAVGTTAFQDAANIGGEWALAGYDVAHKLALVGLWELPFFRTASGLTRTMLGGWQLAGSAIFQTGSPINVTNNAAFPRGDFNADGNGGDRPNAPASSVKQDGWSQAEYLAGIFQASDFPAPAAGQNGNLVRNAFRGPGYADVSLSLSKKFEIRSRVSAELRLDAFNAFNRVNLSDPNMDLSSTNFGRSTSQLAPRMFQTGVRLRF